MAKAVHKQCKRVVEALATRDAQPSARAWFERIIEALDADEAIDDDTVQQLEWRCRGDYGLALHHFEMDADAHIWFWKTLFGMFPDNAWVQALYADQLYQYGDLEQQRHAYRLYLDAVRKDPQEFVRSAGEFYDFAEREGPNAWFDYRLARLEFYVAQLARGEMDEQDVQEELREMVRDAGEDEEAMRRIRHVVLRVGINL